MSRQAGALVPIVALLLVSSAEVQGQRLATAYGPEFGAQLLVLRQDSYVSGDWAPGVGFTFRLPFGRVIDGRISFANARTHRMEEVICPGIGACPSPERVSGWTSALTASLGANLALGEYAGFTAVGFGRTWDSQPRGMSEYGGPTWVWDVGLRRYLKPGLGVEVGYRLLRMRWDNELHSILQGIHMTHHRLAVGVLFAPWSER